MVLPLQYPYLGKFDHDLTVLPSPGIMLSKGNHPQMTQQFSLVKYYGLYPAYVSLERPVSSAGHTRASTALADPGWGSPRLQLVDFVGLC